MRNAFRIIFLGFTLVTTACTSTAEKHVLYDPSAWSALHPLQIPYTARREQFQRGNLTPNPSFEEGRYLTEDRQGEFMLPGWGKIGHHVAWADRDQNRHTTGSPAPNRRCIAIHRSTATELDEAEGVISDFIPVMPGNYDFNYRVRLENIRSNKSRLGVKLFDAIVVSVLFFDAARKPVDAAQWNPVGGGLVDASDKAFSFSHYWRIATFPWGQVKGRTYNYPFSEGDIPAGVRYVRLFFGLKGTGTMQVDDIHFGYSKWNFTALERFRPFFDRPLTATQMLIPTPKHFQPAGTITYYDVERPASHLPVIVIPEDPAPAESAAAKVLQKKLNHVLETHDKERNRRDRHVRITTDPFPPSDRFSDGLILSIGDNRIYQRVRPQLPLAAIGGHEQGYVIQTAQAGRRQIVFLMGATPAGTYNAAATAFQLFEDDAFVFHNTTVVDYPDFLGRAYFLKNWKNESELQRDLDAVERLSLYKLNKAYFGYDRSKKNWYEPDKLFRRGLSDAGRVIRENGVMHLALMINPYSHLPMEAPLQSLDDQARNTWTHSSPESLTTLKAIYRIGLEAGADTLMLLADDFLPHTGGNPRNYTLYTEEDRKRFVNLQNAHAHIINSLKAWIDDDYPGTRLEFCPPWYSNEHVDRSNGKAERYFEELRFQIPKDVAIIWTGPTIRSLSIDMADLRRFRALIGRWPMIWDNTLYARNIETSRYGGYTTHYPDKVTLCNLFEPYDARRPDRFHQYNDSRHSYINARAYTEVYRLKYATVADYLWNTTAYDPERSMWKVLVRNYGTAGAEKLIRFSDAYYRLYGVCRRMEIDGASGDAITVGKAYLRSLNHCLADLSQTLAEKRRLLRELENFRDRQKNRLEKLSRDKTGDEARHDNQGPQ